MKNQIDIECDYLDIIAKILCKYLSSKSKVFVFGSRTTGRAKPFSDIDLLIDAGKPLSIQQLAQLNTEFDESLLPYKVDVVDANAITEEFRLAIHEQLVPFTFNIKGCSPH